MAFQDWDILTLRLQANRAANILTRSLRRMTQIRQKLSNSTWFMTGYPSGGRACGPCADDYLFGTPENLAALPRSVTAP